MIQSRRIYKKFSRGPKSGDEVQNQYIKVTRFAWSVYIASNMTLALTVRTAINIKNSNFGKFHM
jgi:hypothetical protein